MEKCGSAWQATNDNIMWCIRCTCLIIKTTVTHRICNIYCFSMATMVTRKRLNVTLYLHLLYSCTIVLVYALRSREYFLLFNFPDSGFVMRV